MLKESDFKDIYKAYIEAVKLTPQKEVWEFSVNGDFSLDLFEKVNYFPKIYWSSKNSDTTYFCFGKSYKHSSLPIREVKEKSPSYTFFYYQQFFEDFTREKSWDFFPKKELIVPEFLIIKRKDKISFIFQSKDSKPISFLEKTDDSKTQPREKEYKLSQKDWVENINNFKEIMSSQQLNKVVLANEAQIPLCSSLKFSNALQGLKKKRKNNYLFGLALNPDLFFISATPETLIQRQDQSFFIDILAGTRNTSYSSQDLYSSQKDSDEHNIVKDYVLSLLKQVNIKATLNFENQILELNKLIHLHSQVSFKAKQTINIDQLISLLHPTPAVGGVPKEKALELIAKAEKFSRGLYAAPFGIFTKDYDDVAVSLRSFCVRNKTLFSYAGCGLVKGSNPYDEWLELENKLESFLEPVFSWKEK